MGPTSRLRLLTLWGLASLALTAAASSPALSQGFIVRDGQAEAEIVVSDQPTRMAKWAVGELQEYTAKLSGAQLPMVTAPSRECPVQVYVGRSVHTTALGITDDGLLHGAFRMVSGPNWLVLLGSDKDFVLPSLLATGKDWAGIRQDWDALTGGKWDLPYGEVFKHRDDQTGLWEYDDRGTVNAVHQFLGDLGVRWYLPGELGEIVPFRRSIALPSVNRTMRPDFAVRNWYQYYSEFFRGKEDELKWQLRLGLNFGQEAMGLGPMGHGISALLSVPQVQQNHPEYFALWNGQRATDNMDGQGAPCLSSEGLLQAQVEYIRAQFDILGEPQVDVSPSDGYADLCQCDLCKGKGTPERGWNGYLSDYVWAHVNRVAQEAYKTHPDRLVRCLAYTTYQQPPRQIERLSPNLAVVLCRWRSDFHDPQMRAQFASLVDEWLRKLPSGRLYIWDYYLHSLPPNPWGGVPVYFPHLIADDLRSLKGKSQGEFVEVARDWPDWNLKRDAFATNHLNLYVTSRLYWDANQDVDALLAEYYELFYGPARAEMKAFVEYAEAHWMTATKDAQVIDRLTALIGDARRAAGDTVYGKRVDLVLEYMAPLLELRKELAKPREALPQVRGDTRDAADATLDGELGEPFWQGAEAYPLRDVQTGEEPLHQTSCKAVWADDSLYLGIVCREPQIDSLTSGSTVHDDPSILNGDCLELVMETQLHSYYQIGIGPTGAMVDLDRRTGIDTLWSSRAEVAAHIGDGYWSVEVRLPVVGDAQALLDPRQGIAGRRPTRADPWRLNVCRQRPRGDVRELSALSPAGKPSFHELERFAEFFVE